MPVTSTARRRKIRSAATAARSIPTVAIRRRPKNTAAPFSSLGRESEARETRRALVRKIAWKIRPRLVTE